MMDDYTATSGIDPSSLPYSMEAEQSVLGAVLCDAECLGRVLEIVKPSYFYKQQHEQIFSAMLDMFLVGKVMDFITILDAVVRDNIFASPEDAKIYLTRLVQMVPSVSNVEAYAKIVLEKFYLRSLIDVSRQIIDLSLEGGAEASTVMELAEQKIMDIRQGKAALGLTPINEILIETYDRLQRLCGEDKGKFLGLRSGFSELDRVITGLNKTDLILIAARPGMGKTSFALNIAEYVSTHSDKSVAVFSLEMGREQLASRLLSSGASIQGNRLRTGDIAPKDWVNLAEAAEVLSKGKLYIDDTAGLNVGEMRAKLRRVPDLGLVVIDYLQLMTSGKRIENRVLEVSDITRNLKIMAKDLNVPVITLSQLSRGPESRDDKRPRLSDLRESGSIEQDADIVLMLYRDDYYNKESAEQNISECIIAKNRHGETATVKLGWDGAYTRFRSLERYRDA